MEIERIQISPISIYNVVKIAKFGDFFKLLSYAHFNLKTITNKVKH